MSDHGFQSTFLKIIADPLGSLPSPFPEQFLVGVDEQQLDLEKGYPSYYFGKFYPDGVWWYYLVGVPAKEQLAFSFGLAILVFGFGTLLAMLAEMPTGDVLIDNNLRALRCAGLQLPSS